MRSLSRSLFFATAAIAVLSTAACVPLPPEIDVVRERPTQSSPVAPSESSPVKPTRSPEVSPEISPEPSHTITPTSKEECSRLLFTFLGVEALSPSSTPTVGFALSELSAEAEFACEFTTDVEPREGEPSQYDRVSLGLLADPTTDELQSAIEWVAAQPGWEIDPKTGLDANGERGNIVAYNKVSADGESSESEGQLRQGERIVFSSIDPNVGSEQKDNFEKAIGVELGDSPVIVSYVSGNVIEATPAP